MKRLLLITGLALALSLLITGVAWAQDGGDNQAGGEVALLLAPLVAAATAVERIVEMVFNGYESLVLNASNLLRKGKGYLGWAQGQVKELQNVTQWRALSGDALVEAENALKDAQGRLEGYLKSPTYVSRKRVLALVLGIVLGVIVAFATQLQMLHLVASMFVGNGNANAAVLLTDASRWIDMLLTGLIIGTGAAPVHSLIGLLQNTKDAVDKARAMWSGNAYNTALDALKKEYDLQMPREEPAMERGVLAAAVEPGLEEVEEVPQPPMGSIELDRRLRSILR